MNIQSKILAIADIFEALTATDRPYKKPNSIDKAFKILLSMAENNELDSNIVKFFIENYSVWFSYFNYIVSCKTSYPSYNSCKNKQIH